MHRITCELSGEEFEVSDLEEELRAKLNATDPRIHPKYMFRHLLAFWQHFSLYKRTSAFSGKSMVATFSEECPYPIWRREEWLANADPPQAKYDSGRPFFEQLWELFQSCPIPHNVGFGCENCEYTDDWWYSKDCYLSHSGYQCEGCQYSYRCLGCLDSRYCVYGFQCELCSELVNCTQCYAVHAAIYSRNCNESRYLFDCRNCNNCYFCWNLRNASYCVYNKQLTHDEYEAFLAERDFSSHEIHEQALQELHEIVTEKAYWKTVEVEKAEGSYGNYMDQVKNCENCYFLSDSQDCVNYLRGIELKDSVDAVGCALGELVLHSTLAIDNIYAIRYCYNIYKSSYLEYCGFCYGCKNCLACCGLVDKEYCILNQQYSRDDYERTVAEIQEHMLQQGVQGQFFPAYFAPCGYDDSLAGFQFPLSREEQSELGFRLTQNSVRANEAYRPARDIPDRPADATEDILELVFWDEDAGKPFQIAKRDLEFSQKYAVPLPSRYYITRMKELFSWMFFSGELRETTCVLSGEKVLTGLPEFLDGRIVSEAAYREQVIS